MGPIGITDDALRLLAAYAWPGNVRQLQDVLFRAAVESKTDVLTSADFKAIEAALGGSVSGDANVAINGEARAQAGMGADSGDYDGDGRTDLVLTAFAHDTNTIYRNLDGRQFEDAAASSGLRARTFERMGWGAVFFDADLDGRLDLFIANGHIFADVGDFPELGESFAQKSQLLLNHGDGSFRDVSIPKHSTGRAAARRIVRSRATTTTSAFRSVWRGCRRGRNSAFSRWA